MPSDWPGRAHPETGGLRPAWVAAFVGGEIVGFLPPALAGVGFVALGAPPLVLVLVLTAAGALEGAALGSTQALVLHRYAPGVDARWWVVATAAAAALAWFVGMAGSAMLARPGASGVVEMLALIPVWVLALSAMGWAQWLVLRRAVPASGRWVPVTAGAWLLAVTVPVVAVSVVPNAWSIPAQVAVGVASAAAMGAVAGLLTGGTLARLLAGRPPAGVPATDDRRPPTSWLARSVGPVKVRFAVAPALSRSDAAPIGAFARSAERVGFDGIWLSDVPLGPGGDPLVDLAYLAAATDRLRLGANVVPVGRNPLVLARQLAQLDQLSGGRLLLTFVPGLDQPGERQALGFPTGDRGPLLEEYLEVLRSWWSGGAEAHQGRHFDLPALAVHLRPVQAPLEVWLGGKGPRALDRVARCGDGWLTAAVDPVEAGRGRTTILERAAALERPFDVEHFGISVPYARRRIPDEAAATARARRPEGDLADVVPTGAEALRDLIGRHLDAGLSKFVLRPVDPTSVDDDLGWLADAVLALQS